MAGIIVKPRSRIFHGHEWVYASEIQKTFGDPAPGDVISLKDGHDRLLGSAIYNPRSTIVARRFSRQRQGLDAEFFERRITQAVDYRNQRGLDTHAARLIWSESDGLPGLIVDRFGDHLVLQTLTLAMDQRKEMIVEILQKLLLPASIIERNESSARKAEGLEQVKSVLHGEAPAAFWLRIGGIEFEIDLFQGQKTGFYLDQVPNYIAVARHAAGRHVLDLFSNQGAFGLACAQRGAASVEAVDISQDCVAQIRKNAARNQLNVDAQVANVFDLLHHLEKRDRRYDLIILDPPSFTKSRGKFNEAMRGYKEIHLRALKLLSPGALLATFSCSHHISATAFKEMINDATVDAKKTLRQLATFQQALDHPVIPTIPETEYLKGFLFELAPGR